MDLTVMKKILSLFVGTLITFSIKYNLWPSLLFRLMIWFKRHRRGVKVKNTDYEGFRFSYFSRGKPGPQPSVLMLHGFSLSKDMWLDTLQIFPEDLHVVCIDMPGHGETTRLLGESYTAAAQANRINQFVKCIGLNQKPFHLVGISMGGMVAGVYAAQYPAEVSSLSLLCPAGLQYSTENEFFKRLRELMQLKESEDSLLISLTAKQEEDLLKLGLYNTSLRNMQLLRGHLDDRRPHRMFFITCFLDMTCDESRYTLHNNIYKIKVPTQIMWGKQDQVFDPSGAELLVQAIPHARLYMLDKCGHFITLDSPIQTAQLLLEFYTSMYGTTESKKLA